MNSCSSSLSRITEKTRQAAKFQSKHKDLVVESIIPLHIVQTFKVEKISPATFYPEETMVETIVTPHTLNRSTSRPKQRQSYQGGTELNKQMREVVEEMAEII